MKNTIKLSIVFRSISLLRSHVAAFLSRKNILETVLKKYVHIKFRQVLRCMICVDS